MKTPFGMMMPNRTYSAQTGYRYGLNGQEKDDEIKGLGNSYNAEHWEYDSRLGRRWNVDPALKPYESPYTAFANSPIVNMDPDGADTININRVTTIHHLPGHGDGHSDNLYTKSRVSITQSGNITIKKADGDDVFQITNTTVNVYENGYQTVSKPTTITLELDNPQTFYRSGGHNMPGYADDRWALAANAPKWLLQYYNAKSPDIGLQTAIAYQKDMKALPYITTGVAIAEIIFTGGISGYLYRSGSTAAVGFKSMREFTEAYGTAPQGYNWHHFVEQRLAKSGTFAPELIYSTENTILIQSGKNSPHTAISAFYSSKTRFSNGLTVRKWLESKSFEEQMKFGKDIYKKVMGGQPLPK